MEQYRQTDQMVDNGGSYGGGSGGGSINVFINENSTIGTITATGGNYAGNGSVSIGKISTGTYEEYVESTEDTTEE